MNEVHPGSTELPLVVGVDGSEPSLRAVDWAADEAALRGVPLRLVHASLWQRYEGAALAEDLDKPSEQVLADGIVDGAARRARTRQPDLKVSTEVLAEEPEYALVREGRHASALVLGSRGRGGIAEFLLGSVSLTVAAHATCPVIVLRGRHDKRAQAESHRRILLGVGEEAHGSEAVRFAFEEAERRGAVLEAVRAWRCPAHESTDHPLLAGEPAHLHEQRAAETLEAALNETAAKYPSVEVLRRTAEGPARKVLLDASATADLLVVGARRQKQTFGLQLGRVAHTVLHHSDCSVAVVPQRS
ncbi:universal stress protein [Streptomyces europaeiscabiei]|uniref:universal stress protein n=1 Tax=Streptomyces europaeiscabiei TaxID=146819 RepID=UPI00299FD1FE|nr:universal stress protein [Streptomyces europaeiscabiei]MDX3714729.1 universal stress protein [Streptomyces europaeiscabiei]